MNLFQQFERVAKNHPDKPGIIFFHRGRGWETLTYKQLLDQTDRFFSGLLAHRSNSGQACSLAPGMTAALMTPPSLEFFPFALALLKFGIVPIVLDPAVGLKRVGEILQESSPDIFIGNTLTHSLRVLFGWGGNSVKHNLTLNRLLRDTSCKLQVANCRLPIATAAIIYTSGSTGLPKGAVYTQANLAAQLELLKNTFNIAQDEIDLPAFPLYALIDLLLGVTSVIPDITFPVPGKTDPEKVIRAIQRFGVTNMFASPVVLEILAEYGVPRSEKIPSLKRIITAGAPATIDLQRRFRRLLADHTTLFGIYGATETLPIAKVESCDVFALQEKTENGAGICLGKPIEGVTVRIIGISELTIDQWQDSLEVGKNVVGEITVQSPATTRGYIHRPDADRISKIEYRGEIIHRTGDVGYFDDEGRLWYCGRKSHRVQMKDDVLFTEQIENIFNAHPQVFRTALVGVDGEPVLWVELERNAKANKDKIRRDLLEMAARHSQASKIKVFLFMKKFPTDARHNSKIIREQLTIEAKKRISNLQSPIFLFQAS